MYRRAVLTFLFFFSAMLSLLFAPVAEAQKAAAPPRRRRPRGRSSLNAKDRAESLRRIAKSLGVGAGCTIADIGAGKGQDSWTFADIVGQGGKVFSEEITDSLVKGLGDEAKKRALAQVQPVLGTATSPALPEESVDMAYMHFVYHHFSHPREMLRGLWRCLKPGAYLVIVDRHFGTLTDWVPREERAKKHFWIAETTVVREAREEGFAFVRFAEDLWLGKDTFVLIFQRPRGVERPGRDPDPMPPIPSDALRLLLPQQKLDQRVAFIALGPGRQLIPSILKAAGDGGIDIILEEWATRKDERPRSPEGVAMPSVLTDNGDPHLGPDRLGAVYFLDTYDLLFHGPLLLAKLRERLADNGCVYVLDRKAPHSMSHREASHRRMIPPELVKQEMRDAGFKLLRETPQLGENRFLLVFGKS